MTPYSDDSMLWVVGVWVVGVGAWGLGCGCGYGVEGWGLGDGRGGHFEIFWKLSGENCHDSIDIRASALKLIAFDKEPNFG